MIAWSYSRYAVYDECAARFKYKFLDKLPEPPPGPALARGSHIHDLADKWVNRKIKKLPPELKLYAREFDELRAEPGWSEVMWQFDKNWWYLEDKWSKEIYVRVKTDRVVALEQNVIRVIDYKTGRVKDRGYEEQLKLYAAGAVSAFDDVDVVETELWYLDHHVTTRGKFTQAQALAAQRDWDKRVKKLQSDKVYKPTPGNHCRWCPYSKKEGGPCKF